jgi:hypothetical protein
MVALPVRCELLLGERPRPLETRYDKCNPSLRVPGKVVKGGSFLCAPNYAGATVRRRAMRSGSPRA